MIPFSNQTPSHNQKMQRGVGRWRPALLSAFLPTMLAVVLWAMLTPAAQAQTPSPTFSLEQVNPPQSPPPAAFAADSFAQNCAPCHGETGGGDGPAVASLSFSPTVFADPNAVWSVSPAEMFFTAKYGRIEHLMPPWQSRLSDDEIWQVVMYAWSLHTDPTFVAGGQTLYGQSCAGCHGETGAGDGPDAQGTLSNFSDLNDAMGKSQEDWLAGWQAAHPEIGQDWTPDEQRQVLEYIRTFTYIPGWESGYRPGPGVIRGKVVQGTAGETVPPASEVVLEAYAHFTLAQTFTTTTDAEGNFEFDNLAVEENISYLAAAAAEDVRYSSPLVMLTASAPVTDTTITVYATTSEPNDIRIDRMDWVIDDQPGALLVVQVYSFGSAGDRTFTGAPVEGAPFSATVGIHIPVGAEQVNFEGGVAGGRFQQLGDMYYDTVPLIPGVESKQLVVHYLLPYEATSVAYSQRLLYANSQMNLLVAQLPQLQATITPANGAAWQPVQTQEFQGRTYSIYVGANLPASEVAVDLSGLLASDSADPRADAGAVSPPAEVFFPWMGWSIGALSGLLLAGVMLWSWRSGRVQLADRPPDLRAEVDDLARRIAQLDDRHALGQLNDESWQQQRSQLKARLLELARRVEEATGTNSPA